MRDLQKAVRSGDYRMRKTDMRNLVVLVSVATVMMAAGAPSALSGTRGQSQDSVQMREQERARILVKPRQYSKREHARKFRSAKRRYYYPYRSAWGPFAGPPGL
jgi:Ni/Co efflux regulator RcnB